MSLTLVAVTILVILVALGAIHRINQTILVGSPHPAELFGELEEKHHTDPLIDFHSTRLSRGETGSRIVRKEK